ncbi:OmpA family protein [Carboxylicivirga sediminis]|uniref:OmpA family protein n=1 Tax=Carboxylicivirga sediminis TaxID=2006564 RepID=A0A941F602_9BACT|nr:OmpA family protein [Carboxylicivirga sediminis]MBR8537476.1 OmpA family protein [Carboxylicivirga sediminis]
MIRIAFTCLATLLMMACVPLKQFEELTEENEQLEMSASQVAKENDALKVENRELTGQLERYTAKVASLSDDTLRLSRKNQRLQQRYDELFQNYTELLDKLKTNSGSNMDNKKLLAYLQKLQDDLQKREDELVTSEQALLKKQQKLEQANAELSAAQLQLQEQNKRLIELEEMLTSKDEAMRSLKQTISDALTGFSGDELQVHMKDGKVYVSLEEKLLFQSGRYEVNQQGVTALQKIARVLEQNEDIDILVEGHTDHVPYNGRGELKDNWDLSVKRATSVVRILLDNSTINPRRITAAGRSKHIPLIEGNDAAALQKNRRTEIILTPRWSEVFELLELDN